MPYSQFTTITKAVEAFNLNTIEGRFLPEIPPITPSPLLSSYLEDTLPVVATASEKARFEGIIFTILTEVRRILIADCRR